MCWPGELAFLARAQPGFLPPLPRAGVLCLLRIGVHQILANFYLLPAPSSHIGNPHKCLFLCVSRMKRPLGFRLVPAPTLSNCCHKRKESLPKIWSLHPLKMVLSTRNPVTAPPWIPGKGCALARAHGALQPRSFPSGFFHLGSGEPPGHQGLPATPFFQGSCGPLLTVLSFLCCFLAVRSRCRLQPEHP